MDVVRTVYFTPYLRGQGPRFRLVLSDPHTKDERGAWYVGYALYECGNREPIFSGADYSGWHCIDSDQAVEGIMGFLTLRPGDTDADYFANYTDRQREFCDRYAETLGCEVMMRFERE